MQNLKIYMIAMEEHPVSQMYMREVLPTWKGYDIRLFKAVTSKDLYKKHKLDFGTKTSGKKREFTSTEKAVWYSHFELWCKCLNDGEPAVILEHDSKLVKPLPDMSNEGYKFLSYINRDYGKSQGIQMAPGSGYYITSPIAQRLISYAVSKPIDQNSDGHLASILNHKRQKAMNDYHYIEQINIDGLNTIDHKTPYRKYVGLDYDYETLLH